MKLIWLLFLSSCAPPIVDAQYVPYIELFHQEAASRGLAYDTSGLSIVTVTKLVGPDSTNVVGECLGNSYIQILDSYWKIVDSVSKEELIFHEITHCILGVHNHTTKYPAIMYPYVLPSSIYTSNRKQLLDDMFFHNYPDDLP